MRAVVLDNERYFLPERSRTFDGRDVFVPVASHLAAGLSLDEVGSPIDAAALVSLERPVCDVHEGTARLEILQVDGFGNVQLSGDVSVADALGWQVGDELRIGPAGPAATYCRTFGDVSPGEVIVLVDSDGCLALSVNRGRADAALALAPGATVTIRRSRP